MDKNNKISEKPPVIIYPILEKNLPDSSQNTVIYLESFNFLEKMALQKQQRYCMIIIGTFSSLFYAKAAVNQFTEFETLSPNEVSCISSFNILIFSYKKFRSYPHSHKNFLFYIVILISIDKYQKLFQLETL